MVKIAFNIALTVLLSATHQVKAAENWNFMLEPYLIATSINGDSAVGRIGDVDVDVDFGTILDNLDAAIMFHAEAVHASGWGVLLDYGLMDLKAKRRNERGGIADARVKQAVTQLALFRHRELDSKSSYDLMLGVRHWENELRLKLIPAADQLAQRTLRIKPDWTDGFIGGRYTMELGGNWQAVFYADAGAGDANFTAAAKASLYYTFTDSWVLEVGYSSLWVDYDEGRSDSPGYFLYDTVTHGPLLGMQIRF